MFTFSRWMMLCFGLVFALTAQGQDGPGLGERVPAGQTTDLDFAVFPDGEGLPEGEGTAIEGFAIYQAQCLLCHGESGQNGINDRLVGGQGSLTSDSPVKTIGSYWPYATTVFDYLRRAMPHQAPGTLDVNALYALTAYLLAENGIIERNAKLDATTLPSVEMPNREGFRWAVPR